MSKRTLLCTTEYNSLVYVYVETLYVCIDLALTCVHGASELDEALEGEVGDAGHPGLRVEALLAPRASARLLPVGLLLLVLHWLLQLHALLKARRETQTPADEDLNVGHKPCLCL